MKKGDLVKVRSDIPPDYRIGGVVFTGAYHVPLRGVIFKLNRQTSKGNWYYDQGESSVVFSEEMLIPLDLCCLTDVSYKIDSGSSGVIVSNTDGNFLVDNSILNYKEDENRLQGKETSDSRRDRREGSSVHGRRNQVTIAIGCLSYKARLGKS